MGFFGVFWFFLGGFFWVGFLMPTLLKMRHRGPWTLKMEAWRLKMEPWGGSVYQWSQDRCTLNKEQDPDLDPHKKLKVRSGFASKRKVGSDPHKKVKRDPDQHSHQRDADPQHHSLFPIRIRNTAKRKTISESTSIKQRGLKYKETIGYSRPGRKSYLAAQGGWDPCTADTGTSHTFEQRPRHTAH